MEDRERADKIINTIVAQMDSCTWRESDERCFSDLIYNEIRAAVTDAEFILKVEITRLNNKVTQLDHEIHNHDRLTAENAKLRAALEKIAYAQGDGSPLALIKVAKDALNG